MPSIEVNGLEIAYDLRGDAGAPVIMLTPGGRFSKESPGLPELADSLMAGGRQVLLWDRPNSGASQVSFDAPSESELNARAQVGLIRALGLGPVALGAGSAGSRVALIAAAMAPELVSHLCLWWISGGPISLAQLGAHYTYDAADAASRRGMAAVAELPSWAEPVARNPRNRAIIEGQDVQRFVARMQQWALAFAYCETSPVPGMAAADFGRLTMPTLIYRSGISDMSHTRRTSEWVHDLIPHAQLREPPWGDQEWNDRMDAMMARGEGLFARWPLLAPDLLAFTGG